MSTSEDIKALILSSKKVAAADMAEIKTAMPLTREFFGRKLRSFVLHRYMLSDEAGLPDDFNALTELSLSQSMKISPELVKEFDLAKSCDGATSAMAKKVLLFMTIQRELGIELPAMETAKLKSLSQLADLAWNEMLYAECWNGKLSLPFFSALKMLRPKMLHPEIQPHYTGSLHSCKLVLFSRA